MSALKKRSNSLAGLTLDAVLGPPAPPSSSPPSPPPLPQKSLVPHQTATTTTTQTLFDIIRDEYIKEGQKDRTTWQIFREKLRLKRTGSAWTTSLHIPASDILIPVPKHLGGAAFRPNSTTPMSDPPGRGAFTRGPSMRVGSGKNHDDFADASLPGDGPPARSFKPQFSRHDSVREHGDGDDDRIRRHPVVKFVDERQMSAREAVAAQEAAEAEAAAAGSDDDDGEEEEEEDSEEEGTEEKADAPQQPKQTMSLMDLLEETDRQMGLTGASYAMDDEEEDEYEEEEEEEEEDGGGEGEVNCCVCQVNIRGATFTPCGHTFCKLCSKELMAQKGHCPVCSSFVLEFLEIF
ncbi:E3 ubiquitin-protein ligase complex SLX5-SLX8 subunit SLX8-like [Raphanus sativus]|uniref:E3 ubiquitin-protein ligase complex SLX5-SLX8 subunit SLX8-like n=1 Tax=Raphanus sativus TaxID=3726 RepID=A0A6J0JQX6_RAPSA|nr:E3 ubiquitin-protein ligase complex SLX5-SLX8 subunit SLX8-like [Raphanus sativus]